VGLTNTAIPAALAATAVAGATAAPAAAASKGSYYAGAGEDYSNKKCKLNYF